MIKQTPELARDLWRHMSLHLHSKVAQKEDKVVMRVASRIVARRTNTTAEDFMTDFVTTLGRRIYIPFEVGGDTDWSLRDQMLLAVHEHQHVAQWRHQPVKFLVRYARDTRRRALFEAEAFLSEVEACAAFGWPPPDLTRRIDTLRGYGVSAEDTEAAGTWLMETLLVADEDRVWTRAGRVARIWAQQEEDAAPKKMT